MKRVYKKSSKIGSKTENPISLGKSTFLIIVESPSKCKKIESFLGSDYTCIASKGHLRTISSLKSIDINNNYTITFDILPEKKAHLDWMGKIVGHFKKENIILATDDDREGEAIAWHLCDIFGLDLLKTKRILFHEITKVAIQTAILNPTIVNMNLVHAQHCRQVLDLFIGFKISPVLWKYLYRNKDNSLSAGRCQTPALRLVYDNAELKKSENLLQKWKIKGFFTSRGFECDLSSDFEKELDVLTFLKISKTFPHTLSLKDPTISMKHAPKPFHTSSLLQTASSNLHMSPKETMALCQQLYQDGHITYMRTESQVYSEDFLKIAKDYIEKKFSANSIGNLDSISNKISGDPHEAIRVTHIEMVDIDVENRRLSTLYKLIWQNTVESCMKDAKYEVTKVIIIAPMDLHYHYSVEIPLELGWKMAVHSSKKSIVELQSEGRSTILYLRGLIGSPISYSSIESSISIQGRHSYYTEASLIKRLEDLGIGRPSTFASIVETNIERGYVKKIDIIGEEIVANEHILEWDRPLRIEEKKRIVGGEKNKLVLQPIGSLTILFLIEAFSSLFSYDYTKRLESELDQIANGSILRWSTVCDECLKEISDKIKGVNALGKQSFTISNGYELVFEKYGPVLRKLIEIEKKGSQKYQFYSVKKDISVDLGKLKRGEYTLEDLKEDESRNMGEHDGSDIWIKMGPYGMYIEWKDRKISIKSLEKSIMDIQKEDILGFLTNEQCNAALKKPENPNILRELTPELSIRKGKFGAYIYYQKLGSVKPVFYNIQKFKESYHHCTVETLITWINKTYGLSLENPL